MIISITGGTGFIGRRLVLRHLALGHTVRVLSRKPLGESGFPDTVVWHQGDLSTADALQSFVAGANVLYHCAGEIRDDLRMNAVHVDGTQRLIQVAAGQIGRWVQLSSVGVYGPVHEGIITEDSPLHPVGTYEITKAQSDALVRTAAEQGAFETVYLCPSNVYGEDMRNQSLHQMIAMIMRGLFFYIGPPGASTNYVHVDDVVEALHLCATHPSAVNRTFNLSGWESLETFVETVSEILGKSAPSLRLPRLPIWMLVAVLGKLPGFPLTVSRVDALCNRSRYSVERIVTELGFKFRVPLREGIEPLCMEVIKAAQS